MPKGYGTLRYRGKQVLAHRLAYTLEKGPLAADRELDHQVTCPKRCCRPDHLRPATRKQNAENLALAFDSRSGVRGVTWDESRQKWKARITHRGKTINLGRYDTVEEAAEVAHQARLRFFTHSDVDVAMEATRA